MPEETMLDAQELAELQAMLMAAFQKTDQDFLALLEGFCKAAGQDIGQAQKLLEGEAFTLDGQHFYFSLGLRIDPNHFQIAFDLGEPPADQDIGEYHKQLLSANLNMAPNTALSMHPANNHGLLIVHLGLSDYIDNPNQLLEMIQLQMKISQNIIQQSAHKQVPENALRI